MEAVILQFDLERAKARTVTETLSGQAKIIIFPGVQVEPMTALSAAARNQAMAEALTKLMEY